jgi:hypothetical protein
MICGGVICSLGTRIARNHVHLATATVPFLTQQATAYDYRYPRGQSGEIDSSTNAACNR